jgi:hypothetical protein
VPVYDDGFAANHGEDVALGAQAGAGCAADTVVVVNMRVLRFGSFRKKLAFLSGLAGASVPFLQTPEIKEQEEEADDSANTVRQKAIHLTKNTLKRTAAQYA